MISRVFERSPLVHRGRIIALAVGIVAIGICAALPFQRRAVVQQDREVALAAQDDLHWRGFDETTPSRWAADRSLTVAISDDEPLQSKLPVAAPPTVTRAPTLPATTQANATPTPPPQLPPTFPFRLAELQTPRRHRIADGDNLQSLAEEYLGSVDRYNEIYDANRDVLPSPDLLPIGVEIVIPNP